MEKTYTSRTLFDYDAYCQLTDAIASNSVSLDEHMLELAHSTMSQAVNNVTNYVKVVDDTENSIRLACVRWDGQERADHIMAYDHDRYMAHEGAISGAGMMNNCARVFGTPKVFLGKTEDRYEVADFCIEFVTALFKNRSM